MQLQFRCSFSSGSEKDLVRDIEILNFSKTAFGELHVSEEADARQKDNTILVQNSNGDGMRQHEVIKESYACSSFRNLLLDYPGCVSADEGGNRLFISDINHHRIIITDGDGKILECIGFSPGFEDGEFESAKLSRPAASFYDTADNCLYFVDSENNAIRKADMENRTLETMFPVSAPKSSGVWNWILRKLGLAGESDVKSEEYDLDSLSSPWHLLKSGVSDILVINRSFEMSWIISMKTWAVISVTNGRQNILEKYGDMIEEKVAPLRNWFGTEPSHGGLSLDGVPYTDLISSVANFRSYTIFGDGDGHRVLKRHRESRAVSPIQFSDLGVLGLPYWAICPLERVFISDNLDRSWNEHIHHFSVLPGMCGIRVNIDIPKGTELAAPLEEDCIWRQARGSIAEVFGSQGAGASTEKVGVAQQWFDELDNLAFSKSSIEARVEVEDKLLDRNFQDASKVQFDCSVNTSPGTGEVVVSLVLYLKLSREQGTKERSLEAIKILGLPKQGIRSEDDTWIKLLLDSVQDLKELVFVKPLHLRIRFDCLDHPNATTQNETILTDTALEVNISLD